MYLFYNAYTQNLSILTLTFDPKAMPGILGKDVLVI